VKRITISRDLPFAQKRFAEDTGFDRILFLSDYQKAEFGRATGLLVDQIYLLARAVAVVDREGVVRYLQVVPELSHLPDMPAAFARARELAAQP
jgi:thiol peroxidase